MSIFKSKGIIIKIDKMTGNNSNKEYNQEKIKGGEFLYTIFTKDYGKIKCNKKLSKTEKTLDLGYIVNFEITTKENSSIHKINNIKILSEFTHENKNFCEINAYLTILAKVLHKTPHGSPIYELFDLLEFVTNIKNIDETKLILSKLKIISIFGDLNENNENETIRKILKFINVNKIESILKLTGINEELKIKLNTIDF
ncbi:MAG: hypothetical protein Q8K30_00840 [Candidatus Gracilibacteria bacterium]|nr:hypothetical protein [Candidatus Gracilibacteria bacterium]